MVEVTQCFYSDAVMLSNKHRRSSAKADNALLLLLHKQVHDERGIAESLHAQITRARLTACEVGIFLTEISQHSNIFAIIVHFPLAPNDCM